MLPLIVAVVLAQAPAATAEMPASVPGGLEGHPSDRDASPLQARVDAARPGDRIVVGPGTYRGDLAIDKPLVLVGAGRPVLVGSGHGSVVRVRADGVTLEGFD